MNSVCQDHGLVLAKLPPSPSQSGFQYWALHIRVVRDQSRGSSEVAHTSQAYEEGWLSTWGSLPLKEPEALSDAVLCCGDAVNV